MSTNELQFKQQWFRMVDRKIASELRKPTNPKCNLIKQTNCRSFVNYRRTRLQPKRDSTMMKPQRSFQPNGRDCNSSRCRFPEPLEKQDDTTTAAEITLPHRHATDLGAFPWLGWLFTYAFVIFCFSASRCVALKELVAMYSSPNNYTSGVKLAVLGLGFLEDFVCTTYFACALWGFDAVKLAVTKRFDDERNQKCVTTRTAMKIAIFVVSWLFFVAVMLPFAADLLLVISREMRFTFDLITMAINEKEFISAAPIPPEEIQIGYIGVAVLVVAATIFASVRTSARWTDLTNWNPMSFWTNLSAGMTSAGIKYSEVSLEEGKENDCPIKYQDNVKHSSTDKGRVYQNVVYRRAAQIAIALMSLVAMSAVVVAIRCTCSPLVAYSGLNATLNELFGHALQPSPTDTTFTSVKGEQPWVETYIHPTEKHELFGSESLYRRTTGFQGDLAFNVDVEKSNPPNVLVIGVESFRFEDSRYLVGEEDPSNLFKGTNMTITPKFDRWAKRGIALRNIWSSSPTSRSLESLLFAQVPYDSTVKTGITGGRNGTNVSGLPQLFTAKGYETFFTTGCTTRFENWDVFLPTHGYETVWDSDDMMELAEHDLGISKRDWQSGPRRGLSWGVHDDISLQLLGDLLVNKTNEQSQRMASGEAKKPLFITHYTISSHAPFTERPTWYSKARKPDFSALYNGETHATMIKNYLEMRHFTDLELGKFMDRMEMQRVLNDTIVVIMGDHGQAPEADVTNTYEESVTRVAGAIIAEGRLGEAAGLVMEDAAEQYDILNTLADITGVPEGGFIQDGVGRSLKRKVNFGERVVFSNDPSRRMSIVRGHQRLRYDHVTASMTLHDTETDHAMINDLFPELTDEEQTEWEKWRNDGRRVTAYYTKRWDENCLLAVNCTSEN